MIEKNAREKALRELKRVLRDDGLLVIGVINRYGSISNRLKAGHEILFKPEHRTLLTSGVYPANEGEPDKYLFTPHELKTWIENAGFETLDIATCQGLSGSLREATNHLSQNPENWETWVRFVIETSNDPSIWGCGTHFVYFGLNNN